VFVTCGWEAINVDINVRNVSIVLFVMSVRMFNAGNAEYKLPVLQMAALGCIYW
jgi:hypothetical protein